jgi:hypothetical protein
MAVKPTLRPDLISMGYPSLRPLRPPSNFYLDRGDKTTTMPIIAFTMGTCDHMLNFKQGIHQRA